MILDTAYVCVNEDNEYFTANAGLYRTRRGAQKECDRQNRWCKTKPYRVVKVNLVVVEDEVNDAQN